MNIENFGQNIKDEKPETIGQKLDKIEEQRINKFFDKESAKIFEKLKTEEQRFDEIIKSFGEKVVYPINLDKNVVGLGVSEYGESTSEDIINHIRFDSVQSAEEAEEIFKKNGFDTSRKNEEVEVIYNLN
jgi:hypothetical protein